MGDDLLDIAVMKKVMEYLGGTSINNVTVHSNGDYGEPTRLQLEERQKRITDLRQWSKTVEDRKARSAYSKWLDFHQRFLDEATDELRTQTYRKQRERERKIDAECRQRQANYEDTANVPSPPRRA